MRRVFGAGQVELYGGGGTDLDVGLRAFTERTHDPIDLLVIVSDCHTTWSNDVPPFPVIHHPRRRRRTAAMGKSRWQYGDFNRGQTWLAGHHRQRFSPWRRRGLKIPPDSFHAWVRLGTWEFGMGVFLYVVIAFGTQLIASAPHSIITVFDFTNCYATPPVALPCERVAYRAGGLNAALNAWCGLLVMAVAAWLVWDLWSAAAPSRSPTTS